VFSLLSLSEELKLKSNAEFWWARVFCFVFSLLYSQFSKKSPLKNNLDSAINNFAGCQSFEAPAASYLKI
jgi:hypothetical protein